MEVHNIVQEVVTKSTPKKRKCKKAKWLAEEALQTAEKRRKVKVDTLVLFLTLAEMLSIFHH